MPEQVSNEAQRQAALGREIEEKGTDPIELSACQLALLLRRKQLSALEVVDAFIARIERVNPALNALVVPRFEEARREARLADAALAKGAAVGPLHGVPMTIKEEFHIAGLPTTLGLASRSGHRADSEGPLVRRLRDAGAIFLGKTNVSQLLLYHESDNPVYGRTASPWDPQRTPGGSSGGEAALVAAGGTPLGLGGDLGGSLRIPAHFCGVHTLKPTSGRLTKVGSGMYGLAPPQEALVPQPGPLARSVDDLALTMAVLAAPGLERVDPAVVPVAWPGSEAAPEALRVGTFTNDGHFPASPGIRRLVDESAAALRERGVSVVPWTPPSSDAARLFVALMSADRGTAFRRATSSDALDPRVRGLFALAGIPRALRPLVAGAARLVGQGRLAATIANAGPRSTAEYLDLLAERNDFRHKFFAAMDAANVDVLVCPPHALPALTHGASEFLFETASYSLLFNVLGMPAGVVAAGRVRPGEESDRIAARSDKVERIAREVEAGSAGLPLGVQVAARPWREDLVLSTMRLIEAHFRKTAEYPASSVTTPRTPA